MTQRITLPKFSLPERAVEELAWHKSKSANAMPAFRPGFIALCYNHAGTETTLPRFDHAWFQAQGVELTPNSRLKCIEIQAPETWRWRLARNRSFFIPSELCDRFTLYPGGQTEVICSRASELHFSVSVTIPFGETFPAPLAATWRYAFMHCEDLAPV